MASKSNFSVVIDVGTAKMAAFAGFKNEHGKMEILASAKVPAKGIKRGVVLNIEEAASSVEQLLEKIQHQVDGKITRVDLSYAGQPLKIASYKASRYTSGEGVVTQADVDGLFGEVQTLEHDEDFKILHIIPQTFLVDGEPADMSPVGAIGQKIEAAFKLLVVPEIYIANFRRVFDRVGVELGEVILAPLAAAEAALTDDEKELGAILLDIGAGTTKLAVYHEGVMIHTAVIPFGGEVVTKDIKEGCSILPKWAEQLKVQYGQALGDFADERKVVTIPGHNGWEPKEISFKSLAFIIQARLEEIIDSVYYQIEKSGITDQLGSGIVISGGTSELNNLVSLVKFRTGMDARIAFPVITPVNKPKNFGDSGYLTALGLLKLALEKTDPAPKKKVKKEKKKKESRFSPWLKGVVQGVLDYVDDDEDVALK
ncbi:cell division protein FtsA [Mariniphaga anaerophila]|uniref:Cell division protein FtsA n=1 Tax=Mariniphaga anaerophila TaxID=1484053 RepID=A0A1M5A987_9BACT|nr:cell division protein FtsA [Mariniphaga anaerophila]SHF26880.1 cell division protein FtsA [Mariniphaga anaerophila]